LECLHGNATLGSVIVSRQITQGSPSFSSSATSLRVLWRISRCKTPSAMSGAKGKMTRRGRRRLSYRPRQKKPPVPASQSFLRLPSRKLMPKCNATDKSPVSAVNTQDYLMRSAKAVVSERLARLRLTSSMSTSVPRSHTVTSLKRWSVLNKELPRVLTLSATLRNLR
jgi:hypothetical protein